MSVVIKDMKMPESCYYCGLADTSLINCQAFSPYRLLEDDCEDKRPEWCPLIEILDKHGRIIDEDKIIVPSLTSWADQAIVADAIQDAPTIIEAERAN